MKTKLSALLLLLIAPLISIAGNGFPMRPLSVVVPFAAGGATEAPMRHASEIMSTALKQSVVIENKGGASGTIGTSYVARAKPDGYTLLYGSDSPLVLNPLVYEKLPYSAEQDFRTIGVFAHIPLVLAINADVPVTNINEFIQYLKANPGKLNYGSTGVGGTYHMMGELFEKEAGIAWTHVPYTGGAPATRGLMGGEIQGLFVALSKTLTESDKVRILAVTTEDRIAFLPEVPTFREVGLARMGMSLSLGLVAPRFTPDNVVETVRGAIDAVLANTRYRETFESLGYIVPQRASPDGYAKRLSSDRKVWSEVIREKNITLSYPK